MSRQIKFRAWVETRAFNGEPKGFEYLDLYADNENDFANFPPKNIEQYTGLKDKNGKEIYEGDILKIDIHWSDLHNIMTKTRKNAVKFSEKMAAYVFDDGILANYINQDDVEIIGNIHENYELLEGNNG